MTTGAEKATQSLLWQKPVLVRTGDGFFESINDPSEALAFLLNRWPRESGQILENAKYACNTCKVALERNGSSEIARDALRGG